MAAEVIRTILRYPVGAVVGFKEAFLTEYETVSGYLYMNGAFYVLFSERGMVNTKRLGDLTVSIKKRRTEYAGKQKSNKRRRHHLSQDDASKDGDPSGSAGGYGSG